MQEINLLQNKVKDRTLQFERSNRLVIILFSLILLLEIAAVTGLYLLTRSVDSEASKIKAGNLSIHQAMSSSENELALARGLQAQLKNVSSLLENRLYWSAFLDQISSITPARVQYAGITGSLTEDKIHIEGIAPSYADVGRLLLSLSTSDKFSDVKLGSVNPSSGTAFGYQFSLELRVASSAFKK